MKKLVVGCGALLLLLVLVVAGIGAWAASRLSPAELEKALLAQARATLGTELRVKQTDISLLSGVTLRGVAVKNPEPFPGELLTAEAFVLRYRLLPLLRGRVEVERLALHEPVLTIAMDARGRYNYEKLGGSAPARGAAPAASGALPLRIVMKSLAVDGAQVLMTDPARARLLALDDVDFDSGFELAAGTMQGKGELSSATVSVGDVLFVRKLRAPLTLARDKVALAPIRGDVAGGTVTGTVNVDLAGGMRFVADMALEGAKVKTLLAEAKSPAAVSGTLSGKARFEGKGGLATLRGKGSADIASCRAEQSRVLGLLASVLQVPELANPDFETCHVEFAQTGSRFATPVMRLTGEALRLDGSGTLDLNTSGLDYALTLALAPRLFAKITRPELRAGFRQREDGFAAIDFRLYGTTLEPKTDLLARVGSAAVQGAVKDQLNKLLKKKKLF
jgi:uncharacterized protein involved in outer membrane biogenesis